MRWRRLGRRLKKFFTERVSLKWVPLRGDIWGIRLPRILLYVILLCLLGYIFSITYLYRNYQDKFAEAQATIIELQQLKAENLTLKIGLAKVARETEKMRQVVSELEQKGQRLQPLLSNPPTTIDDTQSANSATPANVTPDKASTNGTTSENKTKPGTSTDPKSTNTKSNSTKSSKTKSTKGASAKPNSAKPAPNAKPTNSKPIIAKTTTNTPENLDAQNKPVGSVNDVSRIWNAESFAQANRDGNDILMFNYRLVSVDGNTPQGGGQFNTIMDGFELLGQIQEDLFMLKALVPITDHFLQMLGTDAAAQMALVNATPFGWPLKDEGEGYVSSGYGLRKDPMTGQQVFHEGLDIGTWYGTPVTATAEGTVVFAGWQADYGRLIIIDHGYGYQTRYGHNSKLSVKPGDKVQRGTVIGYTGNSGRSTGPHLHYEVRVNGIPRDPVEYYFRN